MKLLIHSTEDLNRDPETLEKYFSQTLGETVALFNQLPMEDKPWRYWSTRRATKDKRLSPRKS